MRFKSIILLIMLSFSAFSQKSEIIKLYPNGVSTSNGIKDKEVFDERGGYSNVTDPTIEIFKAKGENTGAALLICPGGGYVYEAYTHEGTLIAQWLADNGITGIVLKYRLPNGHKQIPLDDVEQAMRLIRKNSEKWGIDKNKIGVSGASAGGHLACTAGTHLINDARPDYMVLFYPVVTFGENTHKGSRSNLLGSEITEEDIAFYSNEKHVTSKTPPTLLLLSDDDKTVPPSNSVDLYEALKLNNIPASMYIFPCGGHGWGYNTSFPYHELWKQLTLSWLKEIKMI
ncbi:MAG: alpha/beta hydrolase [Bacteroidales bacterium]|nr:alpha/beta hydrolase [Bacteroidales bacterium]